MRFEDTAALVTGATGGIGRAVCHRLADEGARVAVHYHSSADAAGKLTEALPGAGHVAIHADLSDPEAARLLVDDAAEALDGMNVLVNNAGVYEEHPPLETDYDAWMDVWLRTLALNLAAPANLCWAAARHMQRAGGGRIVNVSSRGAHRGEPDAPAYGAAKAGLNALTGSLAKALAPHGITVAGVAPGFVATPMVADILAGPRGDGIRAQSPMGRVATAEEVAATVAFLASGEAEFVTGAVLDVNGASYLRG